MAFRKKMSSKNSRKNFRQGAVKTKEINTSPKPMRGGIRL